MPIIDYVEAKKIETITIGQHSITTDIVTLQQIFKKIRNGYSPLIAICGRQRSGKSFIGVWLMYSFLKMMGKDKNFCAANYVFYEGSDIVERIKTIDYEPLMIDEPDALDRREWWKKTHAAVRSCIQAQNFRMFMTIVVSPHISDVDVSILKFFDFILRVDDRGDVKSFKLFKRYDEFDAKKNIYKIFLDNFYVKKELVPAKVWREYDKYSREQKNAILNERALSLKPVAPKSDRLAKEFRKWIMAGGEGEENPYG
jgi:hypothetical protein